MSREKNDEYVGNEYQLHLSMISDDRSRALDIQKMDSGRKRGRHDPPPDGRTDGAEEVMSMRTDPALITANTRAPIPEPGKGGCQTLPLILYYSRTHQETPKMPLKSRKENGKRPDGGWFGSCPACLTRYAFVALLVRPSVADEGWSNRICA